MSNEIIVSAQSRELSEQELDVVAGGYYLFPDFDFNNNFKKNQNYNYNYNHNNNSNKNKS